MANFNDIKKILVSEEEIQNKVKELGKIITNDYKDKNLLLIGLLKGSCVFMSDLMRNIDINCPIDFLSVSSYGSQKESSGELNIKLDVIQDISGKDILIAEDILDSGVTLSKVKEMLLKRNPKSLKIAVLLNKPERRKQHVDVDYLGFDIPDEFVVGYGLDYNENYRNLPYVGVI